MIGVSIEERIARHVRASVALSLQTNGRPATAYSPKVVLRDMYPDLGLHKICTCVRLILSRGKRLASQALNSFRKGIGGP
jgi:hypothetical protein